MPEKWFDCYALGEMGENIPVDCESGEALEEESDHACYGVPCEDFDQRVDDLIAEYGYSYDKARELAREELDQ